MAEGQSKRYEIKFVPDGVDLQELEFLVQSHPLGFRKIYHTRQINNIYFDTPDLSAYLDNVEGETSRKKVRLRWYGEQSNILQDPILEIKHKSGPLGWKKRYRIKPKCFDLKANFNLSDMVRPVSKNAATPAELDQVDLGAWQPMLINSYIREYFLSSDAKFRLTIDRNMRFFDVNPIKQFREGPFQRDRLIMEVKFEMDHFASSNEVTKYFPFRISKSSKYVTGIEKLKKWSTN